MSDPRIWWHVKENEEMYINYNPGFLPGVFIEPIGEILGELAEILCEYEYIKKGNYPWFMNGNTKQYREKVNYPQQLVDLSQNYGKLQVRAKQLTQEIHHLNQEKEKHQAKSLWDSVK